MKMTFIGTSHGVPAADRYCSSIMLECDDALYFIDAGAPLSSEILRYGKAMTQVRAVFTTHAHGDHTFGLVQLCDLFNWYYRDASADFYVTEQPHIDAIRAMIVSGGTPTIDDSRVRFKIPAEGRVYEDEHILVDYIRTAHMPVSYAILVTVVATGQRILFSGDLSGGLCEADVPAVIREEMDAFVCEMAHFDCEHIRPYLADCHARRVYFTHVFPLSKYEKIEELKGKYPFEIHTPADGDAYEI